MNPMISRPLAFLSALALCTGTPLLHASELRPSDTAGSAGFGESVALSGDFGLVGSLFAWGPRGSVYGYRDLDASSGVIQEDLRIVSGATSDSFGGSLALSGKNALIGDLWYNDDRGGAFLYRQVDTTPVLSTILTSSRNRKELFGDAVALEGETALVGDSLDGRVYVYFDLDQAGATKQEDVILTASGSSRFGAALSLSGGMALVGVDPMAARGNAYLFRNLRTGGSSQNFDINFVSSDRQGGDEFGSAVSLSGSNALIGAPGFSAFGTFTNTGRAYLFRNVDTAPSGVMNETLKLEASDVARDAFFGVAVAISGERALVAATGDKTNGPASGAVYLFLGLNTPTGGTVNEALKITASQGAAMQQFGNQLSLDGEHFLISAPGETWDSSTQGKAYYGSIDAMTTLDQGDTSRTISRLTFTSRTDWVIGKSTSGNQVTLDAGDRADFLAGQGSVFIGQEAGSNRNTLRINGTLRAGAVHIGSTAGNQSNRLIFGEEADFSQVGELRLALGNAILFEGAQASLIDQLLSGSLNTTLHGWDGNAWQELDALNASHFIVWNYDAADALLTIQTVPEPGTLALLLGAGGVAWLLRRRR